MDSRFVNLYSGKESEMKFSDKFWKSEKVGNEEDVSFSIRFRNV